MNDRPILFKGPMVSAILNGRKTQTRRILRHPWPLPSRVGERGAEQITSRMWRLWSEWLGNSATVTCPWQVGDRLWVKETFYEVTDADRACPWWAAVNVPYIYRADYAYRDAERSILTEGRKWKPSIFMPRRASRITLSIAALRLERLQEITDKDACAEGCGTQLDLISTHYPGKFRQLYYELWNSINGATSWTQNPWVWVVEFAVLEPKPTTHKT